MPQKRSKARKRADKRFKKQTKNTTMSNKTPQEAWQQLLNEKDETIASLKEENEALKKNTFDSVFEREKEARAQQRYILELQERIRVLESENIIQKAKAKFLSKLIDKEIAASTPPQVAINVKGQESNY
jgi:superfamily I DNA and RNA helicase